MKKIWLFLGNGKKHIANNNKTITIMKKSLRIQFLSDALKNEKNEDANYWW